MIDTERVRRQEETAETRQDQKFTANVFLLFLRFAFQMQLLSHPSAMLSAISQCYYNTAIVISFLSSLSHFCFFAFLFFLAKNNLSSVLFFILFFPVLLLFFFLFPYGWSADDLPLDKRCD